MEKGLNIYQKINAVMKEVKYVQKENKKVNGQYTFVSHDAVTSALHEPMANQGIVFIPTILDLLQDGNRTVAKMEISFVNMDDPIDRFSVIHYGYGIDPQDKGVGKAVSYAVKYALLKTFCLETGDDVEKGNIDYQPSVSAEDLTNQKKALIASVGSECREEIGDYLKEIAKVYKKTTDEIVMQYTDLNKFASDFNRWKASRAA